jgi:hypothetical protein
MGIYLLAETLNFLLKHKFSLFVFLKVLLEMVHLALPVLFTLPSHSLGVLVDFLQAGDDFLQLVILLCELRVVLEEIVVVEGEFVYLLPVKVGLLSPFLPLLFHTLLQLHKLPLHGS